MRKSLASIGPGVHPHQLEVQEFSSYALVIDARAPAAYDEDHLPHAVNLPASLAGLAHTRADLEDGVRLNSLIASDSGPAVPYALAVHLRGVEPGAPVLVYCDRGGLDAVVWAAPLRHLGYQVDVLPGGWPNYQRWVVAGLEVLARSHVFTRLQAPPVGGVVRVLEALQEQGHQVLDLVALAGQRTVRGLCMPGEATPSQSAFESALLAAMRELDPEHMVWVRDWAAPVAGLSLPPALRDALARAITMCLEVPCEARASAWRESLLLEDASMVSVLDAFAALDGAPPKALLSRCRNMVDQGQAIEALALLIEEYIDPRHARLSGQACAHVIRLNSLAPIEVSAFVRQWLAG